LPSIEDEQIARKLYEDSKATALGVAKLRGHGLNQKQGTSEDELTMWNATAKGWSIEKELQLLAEGKSREAVGLLKYPHRQKMIEQGERAIDKTKQFEYAATMAKKSDPSWQPTPPPGAAEPSMPTPEAPPPEPADTMPAEMAPPAPLPPPAAGAFSIPMIGG
jgi:hypothetical protein